MNIMNPNRFLVAAFSTLVKAKRFLLVSIAAIAFSCSGDDGGSSTGNNTADECIEKMVNSKANYSLQQIKIECKVTNEELRNIMSSMSQFSCNITDWSLGLTVEDLRNKCNPSSSSSDGFVYSSSSGLWVPSSSSKEEGGTSSSGVIIDPSSSSVIITLSSSSNYVSSSSYIIDPSSSSVIVSSSSSAVLSSSSAGGGEIKYCEYELVPGKKGCFDLSVSKFSNLYKDGECKDHFNVIGSNLNAVVSGGKPLVEACQDVVPSVVHGTILVEDGWCEYSNSNYPGGGARFSIKTCPASYDEYNKSCKKSGGGVTGILKASATYSYIIGDCNTFTK
jgi:hypothetical protein